jgi:O-Antigen ligase
MTSVRTVSGALGLAAAAAAVGVAVATRPQLVVVVALAIVTLAFYALRGELFWWDLLIVALGGSLVLVYGFANVGVPGPTTTIPLADALAAVLVVRALTDRGVRWTWSWPFVFAAIFLSIACLRLAVDLPHGGKNALRDFTVAFEVVFLPIGYWAMAKYGVRRWERALTWIFVVCLFYFALFSWSDQLAQLGPTVGIQRAVPLLGSFGGVSTAAAAGFFFFALVRPFGRFSYVLAAGFLAELAVFQQRGIYLALPAAIILVLALAGSDRSGRARIGLAGAFAAGILVLALLLPLSPQGRLGPVSPWFTASQLRTLEGRAGPGSGSYEDRIAWFHEVVRKVRERGVQGWLTGVGFGPDLIGNVPGTSKQLRKPHDDYLEVFARVGLPALFIFVGMLMTAMGRVLRAARRSEPEPSRFLWFIFAVAIVFLVIAATQPLLAFPYGTVPLFSLLGAGLALYDRVFRTNRGP